MTINSSYYDLILSPVISEKSTLLSENNQVMFKVVKGANKVEVKKAVEAIFNVKVKGVNTLIRKGKVKRFKGIRGRTVDKKYAIVTLDKDSKIDISSGI